MAANVIGLDTLAIRIMASGGDDCDGLELLTFNLLRRMGFQEGELYRAVLRDLDAESYHMVTLWFPDGERRDPFVLDPSGQATKRVLPLSELAGWAPVAMFDEASGFRVEARND